MEHTLQQRQGGKRRSLLKRRLSGYHIATEHQPMIRSVVKKRKKRKEKKEVGFIDNQHVTEGRHDALWWGMGPMGVSEDCSLSPCLSPMCVKCVNV